MSQDNSKSPNTLDDASRLRGPRPNGQPGMGNNMQSDENQGSVAHYSSPPEGPADPRLPSFSHPTIRATPPVAQAAPPVRGWGQNTRLTPADIKRAVLEYVQRMGASQGRDVPKDIMAFMESSDLVLLDERSERVDFSRAVVTWDS